MDFIDIFKKVEAESRACKEEIATSQAAKYSDKKTKKKQLEMNKFNFFETEAHESENE